MSDIIVVEMFIAAPVSTGGTITLTYPSGKNRGDFVRGKNHKIITQGVTFNAPEDFTIAFNAADIVITYNGATTLSAGARAFIQLDMPGNQSETSIFNSLVDGLVQGMDLLSVELGAPAAADADGICASQAGTAATPLLINGALASGGSVTFDIPRNVVAAWTGTSVLTVTGTDIYGKTLVESSASGVSFTGKKAFKTVTSAVFSANTTGATVGSGVVLGLPVYLPNAGQVLRELEDNAVVGTPGTVTAGLAVATKSTATTADVRGTYTPNSAPDGSKSFSLLVALEDLEFLGNPQFAG